MLGIFINPGDKMIRKIFFVSLLALCLMISIVSTPCLAGEIMIAKGNFKDTERNRTVPYKLYSPGKIEGRAPVIIFSHGLGGSYDAAPYFGRALAENGYLAFFIQHKGSDLSLWEGVRPAEIKKVLSKAINNPRTSSDRYRDLPFVIDELERLNEDDGPLQGKMDLGSIGMAGHSFGARSVMTAAGEKLAFAGTKFKDRRIKAGIVLSPNVPRRFMHESNPDLSGIYDEVEIPLFHVTGTRDGDPLLGPEEHFDPATRTLPYMTIKAHDQYLLVLDGADHMVFGSGNVRKEEKQRYQQLVAEAAVLFFDAYLKGDSVAERELRHVFNDKLSKADRFEFR
jgi:predicted dienelactone hydrolase